MVLLPHTRWMMRIIKWILSNLHRYVLWALLSVLLWGWIFMLRMDTSRDKKVTLFIDVPQVDIQGLTLELEKDLPEGIKLVKIHPFSYADAFDFGDLDSADMYILTADDIDRSHDKLAPVDNEKYTGCYCIEGVAYGIPVHISGENTGCAASYIEYSEDQRNCSHYLCFNGKSIHIGSKDNAAFEIAETIFAMP